MDYVMLIMSFIIIAGVLLIRIDKRIQKENKRKKQLRPEYKKEKQPIEVKQTIYRKIGEYGELKVDEKLNLLVDDEGLHRYISDLIFIDSDGNSHQIDHIVIRENGIFCIETKNYGGWIFGNEYQKKWTQTFPYGKKTYFLNPLKQNQSHINYLSKALDDKYRINSVIVFVQNNIDKTRVKNCPNVINLKDLNNYLEIYNDGSTNYSLKDINEIYDLLFDIQSEISNEEHIENVQKTRMLIEEGRCPRCGGDIVVRIAKRGPNIGQTFYGCSNFPKCWYKKNTK
jgi:restriction system protein